MKILFVINSLGPGGAERVLVRLANLLGERGHQTCILTFKCGEPFEPITTRRISLGLSSGRSSLFHTFLSLPRILLGIRRTVRAEAPDCVVSFMDQNNIMTILATRGINVGTIVSERVDPRRSSLADLPFPLNFAGSILRKLLYRFASKVVVQTSAASSYFSSSGLTNVSVIPNAVKTPPASVNALATPLKRPCIISLSRLVRQKRVDLTIDAFSELALRFPDWSLVIAGDGPLRGALEARAKGGAAATKISFTGLVEDPYSLLAHADIFVLASDFEGFPGALAEAMSMGLCCVATRCPFGPEEIITNEEDGILVPLSHKAALVDALAKVMSSAERRQRLGTMARRITVRYSEAAVIEKWEALLQSRAHIA